MYRISAIGLAAILAFPSACTERPDPVPAETDSVIRRDSAGVEIVESRAPALHDSLAWRVAEDPILQIGTTDGGTTESFFRIGDLTRTTGGDIVVVDGSTREIRVFGGDGQFVRSMGSEGDGPGEFRGISAIQALPGDSVLAYDRSLGRITFFGPDGALQGTVPVRIEASTTTLGFLGREPGGQFLIRYGETPFGEQWPEGRVRAAMSVGLFGSDGAQIREVARYAGAEGFLAEGGNYYTAAPVARRGFAALRGSEIVLGDNARFELRLVSEEGVETRVIRKAHDPVPVSDEEIEEWQARLRNALTSPDPFGGQNEGRRQTLVGMTFPEAHPAFSVVEVGTDGTIWVRERRDFEVEGPMRWSVFGEDGAWVTDVMVPEELSPREFGDGYLLAVWQDDSDVEYVRMYAVEKPEAA